MTSWTEILKANKGLHARDSFSELWGLKLKAARAEFPDYTITGTLPLSFNSRVAGALKNYRIYGDSDGSGVQTENLFDYTAQDTDNGFRANKYLNGVGGVNDSSNHNISEYIEIEPSTVYSLCQPRAQLAVSMCFYNSEKSFISSVVEGNAITTVTSPANAKYVRFTILISYQSEIMFVLGSTAPASYIPYGYKIPISLSDGTSTSNYDLFIGDTKLGEEEYLDYAEQKIYKDVSGTLTPTDPPIPLPAINAYKGENTLSSTETLGEVSVKGRISEVQNG